jgi:hypothetical protein
MVRIVDVDISLIHIDVDSHGVCIGGVLGWLRERYQVHHPPVVFFWNTLIVLLHCKIAFLTLFCLIILSD